MSSSEPRMTPPRHAALSVDMLGRRIDDDIGAELERALQHRRREDIVDDERAPRLMGDVGDGADVDDFELRIGRALEEEGLGVRPHGGLPLGEVRAVDQRRGDAEARQQVFDDMNGRSRTAPWPRRRGRRPSAAPSIEAVTAAMPLAVARAASAPSSSAMRCSNMATVGLEKREY